MDATETSPSPHGHAVVWVDDLIPEVCWRLLGQHVVGRVGFVIDGAPCVHPVNYGVVDGSLVFRTEAGSSLHRVPGGAAVAIEVDEVDERAETGWSVVVRGSLTEITGRDDCDHVAARAVHPWAPGPRDRWMKVTPSLVTGRAISRRRAHADGPLLPYMPPD